MKQTLKKLACLLMLLCLMMSLLPAGVRAAENAETTDFVLILDCSGSMAKNDKKGLAADACKKFMDLLPIENARIAVIAYGYNGKTYSYEYFTVEHDANLVQVLSGLNGTMRGETADKLKASIEAATKKERGSDPTSAIGQGLAAGVDMLLKGGATDGNACLILLSDGDSTSAVAFGESDKLAASVPKKAKEHNWPIFCIELDYNGKNETSEGRENRKRLTDICVNSGAGADGRMKVSNPADVSEALMKIFDWFMDVGEGGITETLKLDDSGTAVREFEVPELASETNIIVSSEAVEYLELTTPKGVARKITSDSTEGEWGSNVEEGSYISVKILWPEPGKWIVKAYGDPKASIHVYNSSIRELGLTLIGSPTTDTRVTKNDKISLQSYFTYGGVNLNNSGFYAGKQAEAVVTSYDASMNVKSVESFPMNGDNSGYHLDLPVNEVPSGVFTVQVSLKDDMFRSGEQTSNVLTYTSENLPLSHDENQNIDRSGDVNGELDVIDLTKVFLNPDGDPITYVLECVSDRNVSFEHTIDDSDYLYIKTGLNVGSHEMQIKATDPDMSEPLVHSFVVEVKDNPILAEKIPEQELWSDSYNFQDAGNMVLDLDLGEYFSDPDGVALTYGEVSADVEGQVVVTRNGSMIHVEPVSEGVEGDVVLSGTVSDGVSTIPAEIRIEVVSGKSEFWRENWIWFALAVAIVFVIIMIIIVMYKNTLVKGVWQITMTNENGESCSCSDVNIPVLTACGKKRKFTLVSLIGELSLYMQGSDKPSQEYMNYFTGTAGKIVLSGVLSGRGCSVLNIPKDGTVSVTVNGLKKNKISSGVLSFQLQNPVDPSGSMTIDMELM